MWYAVSDFQHRRDRPDFDNLELRHDFVDDKIDDKRKNVAVYQRTNQTYTFDDVTDLKAEKVAKRK